MTTFLREANAMEIHPLCQTLPEMSAEEFAALSRDIAEHGLIETIWTHQGRSIDGRHRNRALCELKIEPQYREWAAEGGSHLAFLVSRNLHCRHLVASQRAAIAAEVKPRLAAGGRSGGNGRPKSSLSATVTDKLRERPRTDSRADRAAWADVTP
jgi:hypothetical protein